MTDFEALVLGVIQGLTEFLPVSSKGHLVIGETLLGLRLTSLTFELLVHFATLGAVLVVLRARIWRVLRERDVEYVGKLALACLPVGAAGFVFKDAIERVFHDPAITGFGLLFTGCVLFGIRFVPRGERTAPTRGGALVIGLAQTLALFPGVSRSGMTIAAGLLVGLVGSGAAEFSFLLSLPVILAAVALQAVEIQGSTGGFTPSAMIIGFVSAFVVGVFAIRAVYRLLAHSRFGDFAFYCWPAGTLFLLYLALR
ncbi:MAG: undecaprenyl-diphosphate phosphatase [Gemmatimonadetes bacterium]|nr:undecaprenyl-diphosphate phosphatase [Gemmatimonadota bacterium]